MAKLLLISLFLVLLAWTRATVKPSTVNPSTRKTKNQAIVSSLRSSFNSTRKPTKSHYKTECVFQRGDGGGGSEFWVGYIAPTQCVKECYARRKTNPRINGVCIQIRGTGCWCEVAMTHLRPSMLFKTCKLPSFGLHGLPPLPIACEFRSGYNVGGKEIWMGRLYPSLCVKTCQRFNLKHPSITDVVVLANGPGCWCQTGTSSWQESDYYKTCTLGLQYKKK